MVEWKQEALIRDLFHKMFADYPQPADQETLILRTLKAECVRRDVWIVHPPKLIKDSTDDGSIPIWDQLPEINMQEMRPHLPEYALEAMV
jgi:hypothetical protein